MLTNASTAFQQIRPETLDARVAALTLLVHEVDRAHSAVTGLDHRL